MAMSVQRRRGSANRRLRSEGAIVAALAVGVVLVLLGVAPAGATERDFRSCYPNPAAGPRLFPHNVEVHGVSCTEAGRKIGGGRVIGRSVVVAGYSCRELRGDSTESSLYSCIRGETALRFELGG